MSQFFIFSSDGTCLKRLSTQRPGRAARQAKDLGRTLGVECVIYDLTPEQATEQRPIYEQAVPVDA